MILNFTVMLGVTKLILTFTLLIFRVLKHATAFFWRKCLAQIFCRILKLFTHDLGFTQRELQAGGSIKILYLHYFT